jgi:hypothetical protein
MTATEAPAISATIEEWPNRLACRGHSTVGWDIGFLSLVGHRD